MRKGKRGTNMLGFVELKTKDYEYKSSSPNFHKNTSHSDTFQIIKIMPSWSIAR